MKQLFIEFLQLKDIESTELSSKMIAFEYRGFHYVFNHDPDNDSNFVRFFLPDIGRNETIQNSEKDIIESLNREYKVGKLIIIENEVWAVAETFIYSKENVHQLFQRLMDLLYLMVKEYQEKTV